MKISRTIYILTLDKKKKLTKLATIFLTILHKKVDSINFLYKSGTFLIEVFFIDGTFYYLHGGTELTISHKSIPENGIYSLTLIILYGEQVKWN